MPNPMPPGGAPGADSATALPIDHSPVPPPSESPAAGAPPARGFDARLFQILFQVTLLTAGVLLRDFTIRPLQIALAIGTAVLMQRVCARLAGRADRAPWSAVITGLGLSLLLRADNYWVHPLAAAVAIGSKFVIRVGNKHVFNPANLGVMVGLLLLPGAWVSPGQWGHEVAWAGAVLLLGGVVTNRARRMDISWAFLAFYLGLLGARVLFLGQRPAVFWHALQNGSLLLFAFFMISDPMTIPNHPRARVLYAGLVAALAFTWQFALFRTNALLWALILLSPLVPLLDRFWRAPKFDWSITRKETLMPLPRPLSPQPARMRLPRAAAFLAALLAAAPLLAPTPARAFCGFFVARADAKLYNKASQVVLVRDGDRTVVSMLNDYQGELKEFALVVPVPTVLERGQVHVADGSIFDHLDAYSAPRLVEYFDGDPCALYEARAMGAMSKQAAAPMAERDMARDEALGVKVEARFTVGEYDILILSAKESDGLETWLTANGYRIPPGASRALQPYIRQNLKFFVAKVNLGEQKKTGLNYLRPLQFAYESDRFMLPIRLGMINANGPQDLVVYVLTREGRVETTNYRTLRVPSDQEIPEYVKDEFGPFYKALFTRAAEKEGLRAVFTEYAWNMGWCDPCAADPLTPDELQQLGVFWLDEAGEDSGKPGAMGRPWGPGRRPLPPSGGPLPVMLTRLHLRYTRDTFPEDLVFQQTHDTENFQGRYIMRHAWTGKAGDCSAARQYFRELRARREEEARTLASLTGWEIAGIRSRMRLTDGGSESGDTKWWEKLWQNSGGDSNRRGGR